MEDKKNKKADLEGKRNLHFAIGLVVTMGIITLAFEWKSYGDHSPIDLVTVEQDFEEVMKMPITSQPPPPAPKIQPEIIPVPDEEEIDEEIDINLDIEISEDSKIEELAFIDEPEEEETEQIFLKVEEDPAFPGGLTAFYKYVSKNLDYPKQAIRNEVQGKVYVQFVVDTDGSLSDIKIAKGIGAGCDEEALRVLQNSPDWNPGKQRGRAVKVRMTIPIIFKLQ